MCRKSLLLISYASIAFLLSACGSSPVVNSSTTNTAAANTANVANVSTTNTDNPLATNKKAEVATANNAPTLAVVMQSYYDALKKKDDAALQNVLAAATIKKIQADMKAEKKTGMAAYLAEYDTIPDKPIEVRNERIDGDKAVVEVKGGTYVNWTPFLFVNEGGKWKFTGNSPDVQSVTSDPNSKKAK